MIKNNKLWLLISILFFGIGVYIMMVGYHNLDFGQNLRYINVRYNLQLSDVLLGGEEMYDIELYVDGVKKLFIGIIITMLSVFNIGVYLEKV